MTFPLDALDPSNPNAAHKRAKRVSMHTSFFKVGYCLGRVLVCVVKATALSTTIRAFEPIDQSIRMKDKPTFKKLLAGGNDTLKQFKEFYIPTESSSIHFLKTRLCVGCNKGFEIVDLESLETQGLLDPADPALDFVLRRETARPRSIYRVRSEFLLCYDEFAFFVNKSGRRARPQWIIHWEGRPTDFALYLPYVVAFEPTFIEVWHLDTEQPELRQVVQGNNLRCLFANTPPMTPDGLPVQNPQYYGAPPHMLPYGRGMQGMPPYASQPSLHNPYGHPMHPQQYHPHMPPPPPPPRIPGEGRDEILIGSDDRVLALRVAPGAAVNGLISDNASIRSMPMR